MSAEEIRTLYRRWLLELWQGDLSVAGEVVGSSFVMHRTRGGGATEELGGPEGVTSMISEGLDYFTDVTITIDAGPVAENEMVAAQWTWRGEYRGGIPGATIATGTPVLFQGSEILRAESGKFVEYWLCTDDMTFMTQLGINPAAP